MLYCLCDGLKGLPEALEAVCRNSRCNVFVHTYARACGMCPGKSGARWLPTGALSLARDLTEAEQELDPLAARWDATYPAIVQAG